ncbi:MAG TPA: MarR family transcriptional regulator [Actinophytocola sp.]|uniref:GbsR/MarR family transcriptional regulator n=1 Tax=Actinophytocola sp. TaxID=1872138 RepID=UPI002DB84053|nr:MarR family transcriptional regulator [Actinophytocola sp.]HEU5470828.1 MarR family transcriptional regulator [Actinophytocola sp.]
MTEHPSGARDDPAVARFVERLALVLTDAGIPRMPSRVFALLLATESGKATASELCEALHVSPAAISGAVRYLDHVGLIVKARDPGERRDHYEVTDDLWYEAFANRDKLMQGWIDALSEGMTAVGPATHAGRRLGQTQRFIEFLLKEMVTMRERWRAQEQDGSPG